jgi:hypothetical protein
VIAHCGGGDRRVLAQLIVGSTTHAHSSVRNEAPIAEKGACSSLLRRLNEFSASSKCDEQCLAVAISDHAVI